MHRREGPEGELIVSATDLVGVLECGHLTNLDRQVVAGTRAKPFRDDPGLEVVRRRGGEHEQRFIDELEKCGRTVVRGDDDWANSYEERAAATEALMREGVDVIYQATVFDGRWVGHPDFLLRKEGSPPSVSRLYRFDEESAAGGDGTPNSEGAGIYRRESPTATAEESATQTGPGHDWHYEVSDTKLAHTAKASALIQIASYVEQIERIQGVRPERVYVVTGGAEAEEHSFRTAEMMAYYRRAKERFEQTVASELAPKLTYPDPVGHCSVCKWYGDYCWRTWREDDALPLVAGISRAQRQALTMHNVNSRAALSELNKPFDLGLKKS